MYTISLRSIYMRTCRSKFEVTASFLGADPVFICIPYLSDWPLHDTAFANIVWCMAYTKGVGWMVVYCPIAVQ